MKELLSTVAIHPRNILPQGSLVLYMFDNFSQGVLLAVIPRNMLYFFAKLDQFIFYCFSHGLRHIYIKLVTRFVVNYELLDLFVADDFEHEVKYGGLC